MNCKQNTTHEQIIDIYNKACNISINSINNNYKSGVFIEKSNIVHDGCIISSIIVTLQIYDKRNNEIYKEMLTQELLYQTNISLLEKFSNIINNKKAW